MKKGLLRLGLAVLSVCLLLLSACGDTEGSDSAPVVYALDVGQGSSILIRTSEGDILVDAGNEDAQERLCNRLEMLGVERLALLILTHGDSDHSGGADGVLRRFGADAVWYNGAASDGESMLRFMDAMKEQNIQPRAVASGDVITLGEVSLAVLSPTGEPAGSENDGGLVIRLSCGDFCALMMGDASKRVEERLLEAYGESQLRADVLFVGHHGAEDACGEAFLQAVRPTYALISCGAGNAYGQPDGRTLERLRAVGATVLRTDLGGELRIPISTSPAEGEPCYRVIPAREIDGETNAS